MERDGTELEFEVLQRINLLARTFAKPFYSAAGLVPGLTLADRSGRGPSHVAATSPHRPLPTEYVNGTDRDGITQIRPAGHTHVQQKCGIQSP